ncbi:MAG TPA: NAD(P)-dependent alcohol dehydrogenase [Acidimicrobiia bacterium]|nr:NAD(P)-dependent alcohol dehydrogenase [Acidimicrobiia bacterium]
MKAIVRDIYGSSDVLDLQEVDRPVPGDNDVLVRVHASSVNRADLDFLRGFPFASRFGIGLLKPKNRTLGLDVAGKVEAVGAAVTQFRPGDEVWADMAACGFGAFAEFARIPEKVLASKPAGLNFEEAATVPHSAVMALQALRSRRPIKPGQRVMINGAGGCVGPFAVQIAKAFGAEVTAVDHTCKMEMLSSIGADHVIDYTRGDVVENGQRYDRILDIASKRSVLRYRGSLSPGGTYVIIANSLSRFFEAAFVGSVVSLAGKKRMGTFMWRPSNRGDLNFLKGLLEAGRIKPFIDRSYPLSDTPGALRYLDEGCAQGKVVIAVWQQGKPSSC